MNINKANIANALHSVAQDHITAVAEDIYDEVLEKYQSSFNAEAENIVEDRHIISRFRKVIKPITGGRITYENNIIMLTQAVYDALESHDPQTLYLINENSIIVRTYFGDVPFTFAGGGINPDIVLLIAKNAEAIEINSNRITENSKKIDSAVDGLAKVREQYLAEDNKIKDSVSAEEARATHQEAVLDSRISKKVDKVEGKGLSTNDFTDDEKTKLGSVEVTPLVTSEGKTAIATVNGVSIYAPTAVEMTEAEVVNYINEPNPASTKVPSEMAVVEYNKAFRQNMGVLCRKGSVNADEDHYLFTSNEVSEGDIIYYSFTLVGNAACIHMGYEDSSRNVFIGTSESGAGKVYTGTHVVKSGFIGARCRWGSVNIHYIYTGKSNVILRDDLDKMADGSKAMQNDIDLLAMTVPQKQKEIDIPGVFSVLKPDGTLRGSRRYGHVSDHVRIGKERYILLKNFYVEDDLLPHAATICPIVFFDAEGDVVSYLTFNPDQNLCDYGCAIPHGAYTYRVSTEFDLTVPESMKPRVYLDNEELRLSLNGNMEGLLARSKSTAEQSFAEVCAKVSANRFIYELPEPFDTSRFDQTVSLTSSGKTLDALITSLESANVGKNIKIEIDKDIVVTSTVNISNTRNNYYIHSGGFQVTSLKSLGNATISGGIAKVAKSVSGEMTWIWVNGRRVEMANKHPEKDVANMHYIFGNDKPISTHSTYTDTEGRTIYRNRIWVGTAANPYAQEKEYFKVGGFIKLYCEWLSDTLKIVEIGDGYILADGSNCATSAYQANYSYIYYSALNVADVAQPGTFWYDNSYVYYKTNGESSVQISAPAVNTLMHIQDSKNIIIEGLKFEGANKKDRFLRHQQGELDCNGALNIERSSNIAVRRCEFTSVADNAISVYGDCHDIEISRNYIHNVGTAGIAVARPDEAHYWMRKDKVKNVLIYSNVVKEYGRICASGIGIIVSFADNCSIVSNHVFDGYYTGISLGWGWNPYHYNHNNTIVGNVVHHVLQMAMVDGSGIYTLGCFDGGTIENNIVYAVNQRVRWEAASAYYCDQCSAQILLYKNIGYACDMMYQMNTGDKRTRDIHAYKDIGLFIGRRLVHGVAPGSSVRNCILGAEIDNTKNLFVNFTDDGLVEHNVYYDPVAGESVEVEDTLRAYDWRQVDVSFNNAKSGDFGWDDNSDKNAINVLGIEGDRTYTFAGIDYPKFDTSAFNASDYAVTAEFLAWYKTLYNATSQNPNRYFE